MHKEDESVAGNWLARGVEVESIADVLGTDCKTVLRCTGNQKYFVPTPSEIQAGTLAVQEDWSKNERRNRAWYTGPPPVQVTTVRINDVLAAMH